MTVELALIISIVSVGFSIFFGLKNSKKSDTEDITKRVERDTTVNLKLDNITNVVNDIKYDVSSTKKELQNLSVRVATVESSAKQAHHRIDKLEGFAKKEGESNE